MNKTMKELRTMLRDWYGTISIEEIIENQELVKTIEKLERAFCSMMNEEAIA